MLCRGSFLGPYPKATSYGGSLHEGSRNEGACVGGILVVWVGARVPDMGRLPYGGLRRHFQQKESSDYLEFYSSI